MSATGFAQADKQTILARDNYQCAMCRCRATEANHRANRGAGGSKRANQISNGCALCATCNGLIESDPVQASIARLRGVKLSRYDDPLTVPYLHPMFGLVLLNDVGGFNLCT